MSQRFGQLGQSFAVVWRGLPDLRAELCQGGTLCVWSARPAENLKKDKPYRPRVRWEASSWRLPTLWRQVSGILDTKMRQQLRIRKNTSLKERIHYTDLHYSYVTGCRDPDVAWLQTAMPSAKSAQGRHDAGKSAGQRQAPHRIASGVGPEHLGQRHRGGFLGARTQRISPNEPHTNTSSLDTSWHSSHRSTETLLDDGADAQRAAQTLQLRCGQWSGKQEFCHERRDS
mmetsp:Transcript_25049/g.65674  ORF Transcript_25049/g.65674 Transcript_25049/m.65674 type:complete len:229 (-) Transcript_25049:1030-1716(-)